MKIQGDLMIAEELLELEDWVEAVALKATRRASRARLAILHWSEP